MRLWIINLTSTHSKLSKNVYVCCIIPSSLFTTVYYGCTLNQEYLISDLTRCAQLYVHRHMDTPSQRNSQSVLFSCSLPPARFDLISPAGGQFQASAGFLGARRLATRRFQNGGCSFKIQPHSLTFTKISHHSSHLLIFGMLSPV